MRKNLSFIFVLAMAWALVIALCFLIAQKAHGQIAPGALHRLIGNPRAGGSTPYPQTLPGLAYYWVASDLNVGDKVTNWIDRIQGLAWTNQTSAKQPTNSALGVYFDGTMFLTNSGMVMPVNQYNSLFVIIRRDTYPGVFQGILCNVATKFGYVFNNIGIISYADWAFAQASQADLSGNQGRLKTNTFMTLIADSYNGSGSDHYYTNGILSATISSTTVSSAVATNLLGGTGDAGRYLVGYIRELAIITNTITATIASNLNYYATNTYSYTP